MRTEEVRFCFILLLRNIPLRRNLANHRALLLRVCSGSWYDSRNAESHAMPKNAEHFDDHIT